MHNRMSVRLSVDHIVLMCVFVYNAQSLLFFNRSVTNWETGKF